MKKLVVILFFPCLLLACDAITGKEVGRLKIDGLSTRDSLVIKETTLDLKKGDEIGIWSEMDVAYEGDLDMRFKVQLWRDSVKISEMEIDPTKKNISLGEVKTTFNGKTTWSFTGKNKEIVIEKDGKYTFEGIFVTTDNPTLKVTKAELVLKK